MIALLLATLTSCSTHSIRAPVGERQHRAVSTTGTHVVRRGESLFSIAWQHGLDYQTVAAWNAIRPPYTIYPGQRLRLSPPPQARPAAPVRATPPVVRGTAPSRPPPAPPRAAPAPSRPPVAPPPSVSGSRPLRWAWPSDGPILRPFSADSSTKKGITLGGQQGHTVRAAAPGQVVYAGSGLVGYGRLIILKHNDIYLSAYGHNRNLLVNEGEVVQAGQAIAHMGSSGTNRPQLHFEIRRNGKPVDPLHYLPRR